MRRLAIDFTPVPDLVDRDMTGVIVNLVDHPIAPLPDTVAVIVTGELLGPMRPGIRCQRSYPGDYARAV